MKLIVPSMSVPFSIIFWPAFGWFRKALRRHIARFEADGLTPPTRSYRNLICLHEFQDLFAPIKNAQTPAEANQCKANMKPFKLALNDLVSMSRAALESIKKAMKAGNRVVFESKYRHPNPRFGQLDSNFLHSCHHLW